MADADAPLRVVCGPTAAGKTALAMALAERFPIAVLSADSRQVYRGFDVGTAKPARGERALVPHFGIDLAEPTARYSAAAWARSAPAWIAEARAVRRVPLVVGGTGFYIRALTRPLFEEPPLDVAARRALEPELGALPTTELRRWVRALDPERAELGRTQLLRAIEVALLTGRPISAWHRETARPPLVEARYLLVDPGGPLQARIVRRIHDMLAAGWVEEAARLAGHVPPDAPAWNATGYAAVRALARGEIGRDEAVARITIDTRRYAKRQRTWFRHQLPAARVTRLDPTQPDAAARAAAWWEDGDA